MTHAVKNMLWVIAGLAATYLLVGFQNLRFDEPITLTGDHTFMLGVLKDAIKGVGRFNEFLGAPGHKDAYFFPLFDGSYKVLSWIASRLSSNLFVAANLFYAGGITLIFGASFICLRRLSVQPLLAAVASVAFVLTPYWFVRVAGHDYLSLYYSVPFGATLPLFLAMSVNNKELLTNAKSPFTILALVFIGTSGFYYAFFSCLFLSLVMMARSFNQRRFLPLAACAAICSAVIALLIFSAYGFSALGVLDGSVAKPPSRSAIQQFYHGLEIGGALQSFSKAGLFVKKFADYQMFSTSVDGMSQLAGEGDFPEWPGVFLTTGILAAPIAMFVSALSTAQRNARSFAILLCFAFVTFGLVFATRGGLGFIFNSIFSPAVRAQERIMPFLMFFIIVAVCLLSEIPKTRTKRWIATGLAALCLLSGIGTAYNGLAAKQSAYLASTEQQAYRKSAIDMLEAKDSAGLAQILQLPVMVWPEAPPRRQLLGYEHALPYLLDKPKSQTRWSYGLAKGQTQLEYLSSIQRDPAGIPAEVKSLRFDGILIEKIGYAPEELASLLATIQTNGACKVFEDSYRALFSICK